MSEEIKEKEKSRDMADQIKICLLGGSGTGKSCFFSGLYQAMVGNSVTIGSSENKADVFLNVVEIDKTEGFFGDNETIKNAIYSAAQMENDYLIDERGFDSIVSTAESTAFIFELYINNTVCCEIKIMDYAGELLDNPTEETAQTDLDRLCQLLGDCDAIIIFADAIEVAKNINNRNQLQQTIHALRLNSMFTSILQTASRNRHKLSTLIVLSKSDSAIIPDNIRANNFSIVSDQIANEIFRRTINQTQSAGGSTGVVPISAVGDHNTNRNNEIIRDADISQKNIDVSVLFCIYNAVERKIAHQNAYLEELNYQLKKLGWNKKAEKQDIKTMIDNLTKRRDLLQNIREILKSDSDYFDKNINELHMYGTTMVGSTSDTTYRKGKK